MRNGREHQSTPAAVFEWASRRWGPFTLDASASDWNSKRARYYDSRDDGLKQVWRGRVWVNPDWGDIGPWVEKAIDSVHGVRTCEIVVMLVPSRSGRDWYRIAKNNLAHKIDVLSEGGSRMRFGSPPGHEDGGGGFEDVSFIIFEREPFVGELEGDYEYFARIYREMHPEDLDRERLALRDRLRILDEERQGRKKRV